MIKYSFSVSPTAKAHLREIREYFVQLPDGEELARKIITDLLEAIEDICFMPNRFSAWHVEWLDVQNLRRRRCGKYLIFFFVDESSHVVNVLAVLHYRRDVNSFLTTFDPCF